MKKILIMLLTVLAVVMFISCDENTKIIEKATTEYINVTFKVTGTDKNFYTTTTDVTYIYANDVSPTDFTTASEISVSIPKGSTIGTAVYELRNKESRYYVLEDGIYGYYRQLSYNTISYFTFEPIDYSIKAPAPAGQSSLQLFKNITIYVDPNAYI